MLVFHTEIHIITFLVILVELVFFFYQIIYYLSRPSDKTRLYYLILLYLFIQHNFIGGLFPDKNIPIPIIIQNILAYAVAFMLGMYFPYYFYKAFGLVKLKFYAYWGSIAFLLGPFLLCFIIPYYLTNDFALSRKITMIVPAAYSYSFLYSLARAIKIRNQTEADRNSRKEIIGMYIAVILFTMLPIITFFETDLNNLLRPILHFHNGSQVVEIITINSGLLAVTALFIRQTIKQSRREYEKLLESEKKLLEANSDLTIKVMERTHELELINEQRINTFINLAHETKTPLTLINNYLNEYVEKYKETNAAQTQELNIIRSSIRKLTRDIINFFDLERIRKGFHLYDHNQISDFSCIIQENLPLFRRYALQKQIEITDDIGERVLIQAAPEALDRVINNLIENAIKYTPYKGKIHIFLNIKDSKIAFSVSDNGIGIPDSMREKVFNPYSQLNYEKSNFQGMGLGLSIVKKIADDLNGVIVLKSVPGQGTEMTMLFFTYKGHSPITTTIPAKDSNTIPEIYPSPTLRPTADNSRPVLLLVEDNLQLLHFILKKLSIHYEVETAVSGADAIEKIKEMKRLDLIISDVMMDKGDGYELCRSISSQVNYCHIPFIFITAKTTPEDKIKGLALGAIDYLYKPFLIEELQYKIDSLLNNMALQRKAVIDNAYKSLLSNSANASSEHDSFLISCKTYGLTIREQEIVRFIAKGLTHKEIADVLFISDKTVSKHIQNIFDKASVGNKVELLNKLNLTLASFRS
jgi:signal transduction histidine kinase/DNA-binding NarL/FixJ family response regulator